MQDDDRPAWLELWNAYLAFYGKELQPAVTNGVWARLLASDRPEIGLVAEVDEMLAGFAHIVPTPITWSLAEAGYLEDLFVDRQFRRLGVGQALMENILTLAIELGWCRLFWHTSTGNSEARRLYDTFVAPDDTVRYSIPL